MDFNIIRSLRRFPSLVQQAFGRFLTGNGGTPDPEKGKEECIALEIRNNEGKTEERNEKADSNSSSSSSTEAKIVRKQRSGSGQRQQGNRRVACACSVVSTVSIMICGTCLFAVSTHEMSSGSIPQAEPHMDKNCTDFAQKGIIFDFDQQQSKLNGSRVQYRCGTNAGQMSAYLELILTHFDSDKEQEEKILPTFDRANFSLSKASAHKRLQSSPFTKNKKPIWTTHNHHLHFNDQILSTEHVRNVKVSPSQMTVLITGYYGVYASVEFQPHSQEFCKNLTSMQRTCDVFLMKNGPHETDNPQIILHAVSDCCGSTSYIFGNFHLKPGDGLHVELSMHGGVIYDSASTFMGIVMLSEDVAPGKKKTPRDSV